MRVDFPAFGRPTMATNPQRVFTVLNGSLGHRPCGFLVLATLHLIHDLFHGFKITQNPLREDGSTCRGSWRAKVGGDVLSHRASPAVPSALRGLTSVFGMGTGVSLALQPPTIRSRVQGVGSCFKIESGLPGLGTRPTRGYRARACVLWWPFIRCPSEVRTFLRPTGEEGLSGQASRGISTARLHVLPRFHLPPINVIVSHAPSGALRPESAHLEVGFPLRCFQRLSRPNVATRRCPWRDNRYTSGWSIPVLSY
jgi:hypothetical protein